MYTISEKNNSSSNYNAIMFPPLIKITPVPNMSGYSQMSIIADYNTQFNDIVIIKPTTDNTKSTSSNSNLPLNMKIPERTVENQNAYANIYSNKKEKPLNSSPSALITVLTYPSKPVNPIKLPPVLPLIPGATSLFSKIKVSADDMKSMSSFLALLPEMPLRNDSYLHKPQTLSNSKNQHSIGKESQSVVDDKSQNVDSFVNKVKNSPKNESVDSPSVVPSDSEFFTTSSPMPLGAIPCNAIASCNSMYGTSPSHVCLYGFLPLCPPGQVRCLDGRTSIYEEYCQREGNEVKYHEGPKPRRISDLPWYELVDRIMS